MRVSLEQIKCRLHALEHLELELMNLFFHQVPSIGYFVIATQKRLRQHPSWVTVVNGSITRYNEHVGEESENSVGKDIQEPEKLSKRIRVQEPNNLNEYQHCIP